MKFQTTKDGFVKTAQLALPPGKGEAFYFDDGQEGLSVRVRDIGRPAFVVWRTVGGQRRRKAIGATAEVTLEDARTQAKAIRSGREPAVPAMPVAPAAPYTLGDLIAEYLAEHAEHYQRPRTLIETKRALNTHWQPLHALPVSEVTRQDIATRLRKLAKSTGPVGANRARANLSACFTWAIRAGAGPKGHPVESNPVVGTIRGEETSRDRVLSPAELRAIWKATTGTTGHDAIIRLLMLTGARKSEVGGMEWEELNGALWTLPARRAKNGREHETPLSRQARKLIDALPQTGPWLFGRRGKSPFSGM